MDTERGPFQTPRVTMPGQAVRYSMHFLGQNSGPEIFEKLFWKGLCKESREVYERSYRILDGFI